MVVLPAIVSCRAISRILHDDLVAEVDGTMLFKSDLEEVIPIGISSEDSLRFARQYINTWASDLVFQKIAEQQLSKSEKDVSKELEDYRKSLLKYRYEQLFVNERLDTSVSAALVDEYYFNHKEKFVLSRPVVKARYLCISEDSPSLEKIRRKMSSREAGDIMEADSLAYSSAMKFTAWNDDWIDIVTLAREYNIDYQSLLDLKKGPWIERRDSTGLVRISYLSDIKVSGEMSPVEYSTPMIKAMIISARRQALISDLERDLLEDARENGKFIVY